MGFNYSREYKKWLKWKEKEEELLRSLEVPEKIIEELRSYDWAEFNRKRRILSKQIPTKDIFFGLLPVYDSKEITNIEDLLNEIDDENLYNILQNTDRETLNIILLRMLGYTMPEIAKMTGIPRSSIYDQIHLLKEKIKKI